MRNVIPYFALLGALTACSSEEPVQPGEDASTNDASAPSDASRDHAAPDAAHSDASAPDAPDARADATRPDAEAPDASADADAADAEKCTTRITYGNAWIAPGSHPQASDVVDGDVTWDGACTDDGPNSFAVLSNGWKPYFTGHSGCVMAFDHTGCGAPAACSTRVAYGAAWAAPANHPNHFDDVPDRILWDGRCIADGASSYAQLSNGWAPHFAGSNACSIGLEYRECGGLYANPELPGCADPGVLRDGNRYVLVCTSGNSANAFPIRVSTDLVTWTSAGHVFPSAQKPSWAQSDYWAPEIHKVGAGFVAYYTARHTDGKLSIGAATASSSTGPFTDIGAPLLHDSQMGLIDATHYEAPNGTHYLLWKEDGNAVGKPTPIHAQELAADGRSLVGARTTLITNDRPWEGAVVEGPWMVAHGGSYYLFYSGNSYANGTYAVGVARASSPLGPYTKATAPILVTNADWVGPGHCSVVDAPSGEAFMVYHAWKSGHVNGPGDGRLLLVDRMTWNAAGWPVLPAAPSSRSQPIP